MGLETPQSAGENFGCTWEHLGALTTDWGASGSAGEKSVSTSNHSRAVREKHHLLWEHFMFVWKS